MYIDCLFNVKQQPLNQSIIIYGLSKVIINITWVRVNKLLWDDGNTCLVLHDDLDIYSDKQPAYNMNIFSWLRIKQFILVYIFICIVIYILQFNETPCMQTIFVFLSVV